MQLLNTTHKTAFEVFIPESIPTVYMKKRSYVSGTMLATFMLLLLFLLKAFVLKWQYEYDWYSSRAKMNVYIYVNNLIMNSVH